MTAQDRSFVVVIWPPIPKVASLSHSRGLMSTLTCKTHMFCIILLFRSFFFFLKIFKNTCNLQQIRLTGLSRAAEMLTCAQTSLFTTFQAPFFQGGGFGDA